MKILDCYNVDSTFATLSVICGIPTEKLRYFLKNWKKKRSDNHDPSIFYDPAKHLFEDFSSTLNPSFAYDTTCWYHFAVLPASYTFAEGLKPLQKALPNLFAWLRELVSEQIPTDQWLQFEEGVLEGKINPGTFHYRRIAGNSQQGPFGNLVRDFAFHATPKRDYFRRLPEAIEDIIAAIDRRFGINLEQNYLDASSSYIIKFQTHDTDAKYLETALFYLYNMIHNQALCDLCNVNCSLSGKTIKHRHILKIEEYSEAPPLIFSPLDT